MRPPVPDAELLRIAGERLERVLHPAPPRRAAGTTESAAAMAPVALRGLAATPGPAGAQHAVPPGNAADELPVAPGGPPGAAPAGRWTFSRRQAGVVWVLVLLGLLGTGWALLRARPVALASPTTVAVATASPTVVDAPTTPTPSATPRLVVHVLGAVRRPGLVRLPHGARVADALQQAGGLRENADPGELNLAQVLLDGQQVVIGTRRAPAGEVRGPGDGPGEAPGGTGGAAGGGSRLDLNTATQPQLEELPGVGPVTAAAILDWRREHSRFSRTEELQEVDGIGPKTYARIAPYVKV